MNLQKLNEKTTNLICCEYIEEQDFAKEDACKGLLIYL
jgi:hypothetical protein